MNACNTLQHHSFEPQARPCSANAGTCSFGATDHIKRRHSTCPTCWDVSSVSTQPQSSRLRIDDEDEDRP